MCVCMFLCVYAYTFMYICACVCCGYGLNTQAMAYMWLSFKKSHVGIYFPKTYMNDIKRVETGFHCGLYS